MTRRAISIPRAAPLRYSRSALAVSLLAHALVLAAVARFNRPAEIRPAARVAPPGEVVYLDFPRVAAPAAPGGTGLAAPPISPPRTPSGATIPGETSAGTDAVGSRPTQPAAAAPALRAGFRDSRLSLDPRALIPPPPPPRPAHERLGADARAAILAEPDSIAARRARELASRQVTILGRKVTVFGDSAAAGFRSGEIELRPDVQTLSVDGRSWERLEMSRQEDALVRDSVLRARTRATRERVDAARRAGQPKP